MAQRRDQRGGGHSDELTTPGWAFSNSRASWRCSRSVLSGRFKVRVGDDEQVVERGGFALLPSGLPHAFLNLTDEDAEVVVVYASGGGHRFYEELGPLTREGTPDRAEVAAYFERHGMTLLGPPLSVE